MTRAQFLKVLAKYPGVTVDAESESNGVLILDTPKGKVFAANNSHCLVEPFDTNNDGHSWKAQAYADLAERLNYGLRDCGDPECDICSEEK